MSESIRQPHEKEFKVNPIGVMYICEFCNEGEMKVDIIGTIKTDIGVPLFPHKCTKCGKTMHLPKQYPYIDWIRCTEEA